MSSSESRGPRAAAILLAIAISFGTALAADTPGLWRKAVPEPTLTAVPSGPAGRTVVMKIVEGIPRPKTGAGGLVGSAPGLDELNKLLANSAVTGVTRRFNTDAATLDSLRARAAAKSPEQPADLNRYFQVEIAAGASGDATLDLINSLNAIDVVEIAYFAPQPELATITGEAETNTPGWETGQFYLQPAPTGIDAYAAWNYPGGKGDGIQVIDIEGNWIQTHEDLHGGTDNFHIAGSLINDPGWWNHGTAVLGEIAADSNDFGMTGIAFNVDLGTVSIGSMSTAEALVTAMNHSEPGDIILIELHAPGPHYNFEPRDDQLGYVPMEYWQEVFDAIQQASALGLIVVEAGGNGAENLSDTTIYGRLFDPDFRHSGAIMVAASDADHYPAGFTNYGARLDVHAFGTWNVYTLGYGDLYGSGPNDHYTATFAGTSSASPIIVGACAALQGIHMAVHGWTMDHSTMRNLLTTYSTPQSPHPKPIGPLPDLAGGAAELVGVSFAADTIVGWLPLEVNFTASSGLAVDSWSWNFGDGASDSIQNPSHVYDTRGRFDVTLEIQSGEDIRSLTRDQYIAVLADTLKGDSIQVTPGETVEVVISVTNTLPLAALEIPVEYDGQIDLAPAITYWSTAGCRAEHLDYQEVVHLDPFNKRMTFRLANDQGGGDLPPGEGPVLKLYFELDTPPVLNQTTEIKLDGYSTRQPWFRSTILEYQPRLDNPLVAYSSCCVGIRGNVDGDPLEAIDIADLVYLVTYMFGSGPEPPCLKEANVNGDIFERVDIEDLVYLASYMFSQGPAPVVCF